jgi:hypothetical protein
MKNIYMFEDDPKMTEYSKDELRNSVGGELEDHLMKTGRNYVLDSLGNRYAVSIGVQLTLVDG